MKKVGGRFALLALVVVLSVVFFLPSYRPLYQGLPDWARKILPDKGITLGLDLQGGIHMVMEVDEDRAVEIAVERSLTSLQDVLVDKKLPAESVKRTASNQITIQFANAELKPQIQKLSDEYPTFFEVDAAGSPNSIVWELRETEIKRIKDSAMVAAAVLSNRYISDRFLPDKAIDLVDEAAAKTRTEIDSMPADLDEITFFTDSRRQQETGAQFPFASRMIRLSTPTAQIPLLSPNAKLVESKDGRNRHVGSLSVPRGGPTKVRGAVGSGQQGFRTSGGPRVPN